MENKTCKMEINEQIEITSKMTIPQLKDIARKRGLGGYSHMNKAALLSLLCAKLQQEKDLGVWHGYGYQDMTKKELRDMAKKLGVTHDYV